MVQVKWLTQLNENLNFELYHKGPVRGYFVAFRR